MLIIEYNCKYYKLNVDEDEVRVDSLIVITRYYSYNYASLCKGSVQIKTPANSQIAIAK